jgi:hypothetical protein
VARLCAEWPDGWALHTASTTLAQVLAVCPPDVRIGAWCKSFASFKPGVGVAYAWEPVILRGGRRRTREQPTVRDWCLVPITLRRGLVGAKPDKVTFWICEVLNVAPEDTVTDLFPGSGAVGAAVAKYQRNELERSTPQPLFAESVA